MINKAKKLNDDLKELDVSKEYFNLKKLILEDSYLNDLLDVINKTQKEMKEHLKNNDIKSYNASKKTLEVLKQEFIENPLINNYIVVKKEVYDVLEQVVNILSE